MVTRESLFTRKLSASKFSIFYTPEYATELVVPYFKKYWKVWEPACGDGHITRVLWKAKLDVVSSDIIGDPSVDFLNCDVPFGIDAIITNPPYNLKNQFLQRCYEIGLPFALLMPITALGSMARVQLYTKYGIQVLVPDKRINFIYADTETGKPTDKKACWFHTAWFCWKLLPKDLVMKEMIK